MKILRRYLLIANSKNRGLAYALNQGIKIARGRYLLTMDSDVEVLGNSIPEMYSYLEKHPGISGVATDEFTPGGKRKRSRTKIGLERRKRSYSKPFLIEFTGNTFSMITEDVYQNVGLYDETFTYSVEDLDWAHRAKLKGYKFILLPQCKIIHHGRKGKYQNYSAVVEERYRTNLYYYKKFYSPSVVCVAYWIMRFKIWVKILKAKSRELKEAYRRAEQKMIHEHKL